MMDGRQFDALSRTVAAASTRRGILQLLGAMPLLGLLLGFFGDEEASARRRQKNRQRRNNGRKGVQANHHNRGEGHNKKPRKNKSRKKRQQPCNPKSAAQACTGRCGQVASTCGPAIDCGPCDCGACAACQICDAATGRCRANPAFLGQACGAPGQVCQDTGVCACDTGSCLAGQRCNGIACVCDATTCPNGCCDSGRACRINEDAACGTGGGVCSSCDDQCVDGACTCATTCPLCQSCNPNTGLCRADAAFDGDACGPGQRCLAGQCICDATSCPTGCCDGNVCRVGAANACGSGGGVCTPCSTPGQGCEGGACCAAEGSASAGNLPCCSGLIQCANGVCKANCCTGVTCSAAPCEDPGVCDAQTGLCSFPTPKGNGAPCDDGDPCLRNSICTNSVCGGGSTICTNPEECRTAVGATCSAGVCTYPLSSAGTSCGSVPCGSCDASGACVGCPALRECVNGFCCGLSGASCSVVSDCCECDGCDCSRQTRTCFQSEIG